MRSAHVGTHTEDKISFQCRSRVVQHWLKSNRRFGSSTTFSRMAAENSTASSDRLAKRTCGVQAERTWSNGAPQVEDANNARMDENGNTSYPQSVYSRQSRRLHDQNHDPRETDQVWTCSELEMILLHRREPTCTVTSVTPITVLMNTDK